VHEHVATPRDHSTGQTRRRHMEGLGRSAACKVGVVHRACRWAYRLHNGPDLVGLKSGSDPYVDVAGYRPQLPLEERPTPDFDQRLAAAPAQSTANAC